MNPPDFAEGQTSAGTSALAEKSALKRPWGGLSLAWIGTVLILTLCWIPRSGLPIEETAPAFLFIPNLDKLIHGVLFGMFAILWARADVERRWSARILIGGIVLAILSELGQATPIVNRDAGLDDTLADIAGLVVVYFPARYAFGALREAK